MYKSPGFKQHLADHGNEQSMKLNRILVTLLGTAALVTIGIHLMRSVSRADLPRSTATSIYQPTFDQWAFLNLTASYRDYSGHPAFVSIERESKNGRIRYKVLGRYANDLLGRDWYERVGSRIRKGIEDDCKRWTAEGFPIGLNDFDIDIAPVGEKPR
jgi:hypothetical protein